MLQINAKLTTLCRKALIIHSRECLKISKTCVVLCYMLPRWEDVGSIPSRLVSLVFIITHGGWTKQLEIELIKDVDQ